MTLHPEIKQWLAEQATAPALDELTIEEARALRDIDRRDVGAHPAQRHNTQTMNGVPLRIYRSPNTPEKNSGALVYFHGGGFVFGNLDTHDEWCRYLANESECVVISVDYRLAPEHPFPAAVDDCWEALQWVTEHAPNLGIQPQTIAVGGDSAGGNLAAVVALITRETHPHLAPNICHQVLLYPVTDLTDFDNPTYQTYAEGYGLSRASMMWFRDRYVGDTPADDWRISPLRAPHHRYLAPTFIVTAEYDVLRHEGEAYARALMFNGNRVTLRRCMGMIHGFVTKPELDCTHDAREYIATELRRVLRVKRP